MAGQDEEIAALQSLAHAGAAGLRTGGQWEAFLRRVERTAGFGAVNTLLIWAQRPDAIDVRSYDRWQQAGRQVNPGENGIRVIKGDSIVAVFDLTQTSGKPVSVRLPVSARLGDSVVREAIEALGLRSGVRLADCPAGSCVGVIAARLCSAPWGGALVGPWARKVAADSVAFVIMLRLGLPLDGFAFPSVSSWAGADERARRTETIMAVGELIASAVRKAFGCLDAVLPPAAPLRSAARPAASRRGALRGAGESEAARVLAEAARFFVRQAVRSWVPRYLASRGFGPDAQQRWLIGYAPAGWTALTAHLRSLGFSDMAIEAAGLARRSSRGGLIDTFRDRAMFPVRCADGSVAGFIGRASPDAGADVPKYLNSQQTTRYQKGRILYGLHEARRLLKDGARPVVVEGPLDAVAVTVSGAGKYAGVAPCGTALTSDQVRLLASETRLADTGLVVAFDGDPAGQRAAVRAHDLLAGQAGPLDLAIFPAGHDPASLLRDAGPAGVLDILAQVRPLADAVIDATIGKFSRWLEFVEGKFNALAAVAPIIAGLPNDQVARQVARVAGLLDLTHAEVTAAVTDAAASVVADRATSGLVRPVSSPPASAPRRPAAPPATPCHRRAG